MPHTAKLNELRRVECSREFEIEFLRVNKDGKETLVDREHSPLDLSLSELKARSLLDEKRKICRLVDAIRIRASSGHEVSTYRGAPMT